MSKICTDCSVLSKFKAGTVLSVLPHLQVTVYLKVKDIHNIDKMKVHTGFPCILTIYFLAKVVGYFLVDGPIYEFTVSRG